MPCIHARAAVVSQTQLLAAITAIGSPGRCPGGPADMEATPPAQESTWGGALMDDHSSTQISDSSSTAVAPAAHPDAKLMALVEKRIAARALTREADDDDADAA
jgi:hypothetical protein